MNAHRELQNVITIHNGDKARRAFSDAEIDALAAENAIVVCDPRLLHAAG